MMSEEMRRIAEHEQLIRQRAYVSYAMVKAIDEQHEREYGSECVICFVNAEKAWAQHPAVAYNVDIMDKGLILVSQEGLRG